MYEVEVEVEVNWVSHSIVVLRHASACFTVQQPRHRGKPPVMRGNFALIKHRNKSKSICMKGLGRRHDDVALSKHGAFGQPMVAQLPCAMVSAHAASIIR
jgi:hypothetical protein